MPCNELFKVQEMHQEELAKKKNPYKISPAKWGETHQTKLRVPWIMVCGGMQSCWGKGEYRSTQFLIEILSVLMSWSLLLLLVKTSNTNVSCCHMDKLSSGMSCISWHC